eukprot:TRINITY_DN10068_c0_g1_i1.p1 TRINITY_DN10068_c0_g1~~TRINITY_DN10068_c0_g1_i1.p1  ORF type:complete len:671 (+),score=189.06 TRINITY_DN10068_c0_g1_i1:1038-3050(+)
MRGAVRRAAVHVLDDGGGAAPERRPAVAASDALPRRGGGNPSVCLQPRAAAAAAAAAGVSCGGRAMRRCGCAARPEACAVDRACDAAMRLAAVLAPACVVVVLCMLLVAGRKEGRHRAVAGTAGAAAVAAPRPVTRAPRRLVLPPAEPIPGPLEQQLAAVEATLQPADLKDFAWMKRLNRSSPAVRRPHHLPFTPYPPDRSVPKACSCPLNEAGNCQYSWCVPNLGRAWPAGHRVVPLSYSLPENEFVTEPPPKDKDCAALVPGVDSQTKFTSEADFRAEYARSRYCITFKKGGWWALRHLEIVAAGCMPYFIDIDYAPVHSLITLPKRLLLEARDLPGVHFNCSQTRVVIDHSVFPHARYDQLLEELLAHARRWMTSEAVARFVLAAAGVPNPRRVLFLNAYRHPKEGGCRVSGMPRGRRSPAMLKAIAKQRLKARRNSGLCGVFKVCACTATVHPMAAPLKAQGSYAGWTLQLGLRSVLGTRLVDAARTPFLYKSTLADNPTAKAQVESELYGRGFGYAWRLDDVPVNRSNLLEQVLGGAFDLAIVDVSFTGEGKFNEQEKEVLEVLDRTMGRSGRLFFTHEDDVPNRLLYPPLFRSGGLLQREISDCEWYVPPDMKGHLLKRCLHWRIFGGGQAGVTGSCFDDSLLRDLPAPATSLAADDPWWAPNR